MTDEDRELVLYVLKSAHLHQVVHPKRQADLGRIIELLSEEPEIDDGSDDLRAEAAYQKRCEADNRAASFDQEE